MINLPATRATRSSRGAGIRVRVQRTNLNDDYLITPNALFRGEGVYTGLSEYARLLLGAGLSCADNWDTTLNMIEDWLPSLGRDRHEAVRRELRERGFLSMEQDRIPPGEPDGGKFIWTLAFFMNPLPQEERDVLAPKKPKKPPTGARKGKAAPAADPTQEPADKTAGGTMPGPSGHPSPGHGQPGPGDQGDIYKEEKNHGKKNHPPTPQAETAAPTGGPDPGEGEEKIHPDVGADLVDQTVDRVRRQRPEWTTRQIRKAISDAVDSERPVEIMCEAMVIVAEDSDSDVPGRLKRDGPWWADAGRRVRAARGPRGGARERCAEHPGQLAGACGLCRVADLAGAQDPVPGVTAEQLERSERFMSAEVLARVRRHAKAKAGTGVGAA